jgi:hypothetical protein
VAAPVSGFATALEVESCAVSRLIVVSSSSRCSAEAFAVASWRRQCLSHRSCSAASRTFSERPSVIALRWPRSCSS